MGWCELGIRNCKNEYMLEDYVCMSGDTVHYLESMYMGA